MLIMQTEETIPALGEADVQLSKVYLWKKNYDVWSNIGFVTLNRVKAETEECRYNISIPETNNNHRQNIGWKICWNG